MTQCSLARHRQVSNRKLTRQRRYDPTPLVSKKATKRVQCAHWITTSTIVTNSLTSTMKTTDSSSSSNEFASLALNPTTLPKHVYTKWPARCVEASIHHLVTLTNHNLQLGNRLIHRTSATNVLTSTKMKLGLQGNPAPFTIKMLNNEVTEDCFSVQSLTFNQDSLTPFFNIDGCSEVKLLTLYSKQASQMMPERLQRTVRRRAKVSSSPSSVHFWQQAWRRLADRGKLCQSPGNSRGCQFEKQWSFCLQKLIRMVLHWKKHMSIKQYIIVQSNLRPKAATET